MQTIYSSEIKKELAERYEVEERQVQCYNCRYWGFNCGKVLNSRCESRCTKRKKDWTWASQYCRGFVPKEKE